MDHHVLLPTAGHSLAHRPADPLLSTAKATNPTEARRAVSVRASSLPPPPSTAKTLSPSPPSAGVGGDGEASNRRAFKIKVYLTVVGGVSGVLSAKPDGMILLERRTSAIQTSHKLTNLDLMAVLLDFLLAVQNNEFWLVRMEKPGVDVCNKGTDDGLVCSHPNQGFGEEFGFCYQVDKQCAWMLADVPGVLSVQPDMNFGSCNKDNKVEIIMDKISKRSKGYAFIEYTPEEAASCCFERDE